MNYDSNTIYYALERFLTGERTLIIARDLKVSTSVIDQWRKKYLGLSLNEIESIRLLNQTKAIRNQRKDRLNCEKGKKIGKLTAIEFSHIGKDHATNWLFKCDCGKITKTRLTLVLNGHVKSCGCLRKEYYDKTYILGWHKNK